MLPFRAVYQQKRLSAPDAVRLVRNDDLIVVPTGMGEPPVLLTTLSEHRRSVRGVQVAQILPLRKFAYFDPTTIEYVRHVA